MLELYYRKLREKLSVFFSYLREKPWIILIALVLLAFFYVSNIKAPKDFPVNTFVKIEKGQSLSEVSSDFKDSSIIRSPLWFETFTILLGGEKKVMAGDYFLNKKENAFSIATKVTRGQFGLIPVNVLVYEGYTIFDIADLFEKRFSEFDKEEFIKLAKDKEGYLFPDTYSFLPNIEAKDVIKDLSNNFKNKIQSIEEEISKSDKSLEEIIIMASIIEKEARTNENKKIISGILWKRIEIGMALQVDAVFPYISGKNTYQLSLEDLKIDSPYNTYKYPGLPIGPIANPGMESILATINPTESPYLFYLTGRDGKMYYAEDFKQHLVNKRLYLDK